MPLEKHLGKEKMKLFRRTELSRSIKLRAVSQSLKHLSQLREKTEI